MKIKTSELTGAALDWAVAKCEVQTDVFTDDENAANGKGFLTFKHGVPMLFGAGVTQHGTFNQDTGKPWVFHAPGGSYAPSTDWSQGGPIIEREKIELSPPFISVDGLEFPTWGAGIHQAASQVGPTPLIAAMRCYVASKLGDEVEVPEGIDPTHGLITLNQNAVWPFRSGGAR